MADWRPYSSLNSCINETLFNRFSKVLFLNSFARELELDWLSHGQPARTRNDKEKDSATLAKALGKILLA